MTTVLWITKLGGIALILWLYVRVNSLFRQDAWSGGHTLAVSEPLPRRPSWSFGREQNQSLPYDRAEAIAQSQILANLQMNLARKAGLELPKVTAETRQSRLEAHELAAAYLLGIADGITDFMGGNSSDTLLLGDFLVSRKLGLNEFQLGRVLDRVESDSSATACHLAGKEAAQLWIRNRPVPANLRLFDQISSQAFLASVS